MVFFITLFNWYNGSLLANIVAIYIYFMVLCKKVNDVPCLLQENVSIIATHRKREIWKSNRGYFKAIKLIVCILWVMQAKIAHWITWQCWPVFFLRSKFFPQMKNKILKLFIRRHKLFNVFFLLFCKYSPTIMVSSH